MLVLVRCRMDNKFFRGSMDNGTDYHSKTRNLLSLIANERQSIKYVFSLLPHISTVICLHTELSVLMLALFVLHAAEKA